MGILQLDNQQKGLRFDGVNDYVTVSNSNSIFSFGTGNFSIATVIKPQALNAGNGVVCGVHNINPIPAPQYVIAITSIGNLIFVIRGDSNNSLSISTPITLNNTYHVVAIRNGINMLLYVNNVLMASGSIATLTSITLDKNFSIGGINSGSGVAQFQDMTMYDLKVFNKALSVSEVSDLYNKTSIPSNCVADYRFNQQSGTTLNTYTGTNNGTLTNYTAGDTTIGATNKWVYDYSSESYDGNRKGGILLINNN